VGRTLLIAIELLAASVWIGSLVCLALVAPPASRPPNTNSSWR
jgi:putative copper export protein